MTMLAYSQMNRFSTSLIKKMPVFKPLPIRIQEFNAARLEWIPMFEQLTSITQKMKQSLSQHSTSKDNDKHQRQSAAEVMNPLWSSESDDKHDFSANYPESELETEESDSDSETEEDRSRSRSRICDSGDSTRPRSTGGMAGKM
ncbi:hypothetical protein PoB_002286100 [Plakobranchus ocellatus]|uniref:Uncharacterized protein n=1 Tax=Plakobranchus ocellatus TaxID=259542 RepID=A0AAV3ZPA8_9GAST|nr:hypothetical protein PoB_002286100 [Plakobranchus ocellatus]